MTLEFAELEAVVEQQEVAVGNFGAMVKRFNGQTGAFLYLLSTVCADVSSWRCCD
ncbi:hypothetical protein [Hydrococcus rivularis]|uniref:hypothetical protein n=1 Tax=Hydrococcus rivularis TaxID=1616834 RepID=UPI000A5BE904|nr:hypothetical protein [Hydrococcus rivularis]